MLEEIREYIKHRKRNHLDYEFENDLGDSWTRVTQRLSREKEIGGPETTFGKRPGTDELERPGSTSRYRELHLSRLSGLCDALEGDSVIFPIWTPPLQEPLLLPKKNGSLAKIVGLADDALADSAAAGGLSQMMEIYTQEELGESSEIEVWEDRNGVFYIGRNLSPLWAEQILSALTGHFDEQGLAYTQSTLEDRYVINVYWLSIEDSNAAFSERFQAVRFAESLKRDMRIASSTADAVKDEQGGVPATMLPAFACPDDAGVAIIAAKLLLCARMAASSGSRRLVLTFDRSAYRNAGFSAEPATDKFYTNNLLVRADIDSAISGMLINIAEDMGGGVSVEKKGSALIIDFSAL